MKEGRGLSSSGGKVSLRVSQLCKLAAPLTDFPLLQGSGARRVFLYSQSPTKPRIDFIPTTGGYRAPPLKTRSWGVTGQLDYSRAEFQKKVRPPPRRMVQRGGDSPLFFENRRQGGLTAEFPFLSVFGPFWLFGPKPVNYLAPYWTQAGHHPLGGDLRRSRWVYFEFKSLRHKYTLRRASEVTPRGWCPVFFTSLRPIGCQVIHRFGSK